MKKTLVYTDEKFISQTKDELQKALTASQALLDAWHGTGIGVPVTNLFELMNSPQLVYGRAVNEVAGEPVTHGKFQLRKDVFINLLEVPVPNELYIKAKQCRAQIQTGRPELWSISEDNKTVILNEKLADELVHSQDFWVTKERSKEIIEHCKTYVDVSNWLYDNLPLLPGMMQRFGPPFTITARFGNLINQFELDGPQLSELVRALEEE